MVAIGPKMFYTVALPCMLWFFDKGKAKTSRKDKVLLIDARHLFRQVDRAHRDFTPEQIEFVANIARLYREERPEFNNGSEAMLKEYFASLKYRDVLGLCKVATIKDVEAQGWSLNPGRYVGVVVGETGSDGDFKTQFEAFNEQLEALNAEGRQLEEMIADNAAEILGARQ